MITSSLLWCMICIMYVVPRPRAPPSEKGGIWRWDYIMYEQRTCWIFHDSQYAVSCMTIHEHAACALCSGEVPVNSYSVSIQAERNADDELWVYFSCTFSNSGSNEIQKCFEIQKFAWNPEIPREIHFEIQKSALKSRNSLEIQKSLEKSTLKYRNQLWNPEIHFEIQKSTLKSRNPFWNPEIHFEIQKSILKSEIHFEIQKSILKSEIHLKSSGFRNLVRRDAPWRTPRMPKLSWLVKLYGNLTYVRMRPAAIALNYSVKDIRHDVRQIIIITSSMHNMFGASVSEVVWLEDW